MHLGCVVSRHLLQAWQPWKPQAVLSTLPWGQVSRGSHLSCGYTAASGLSLALEAHHCFYEVLWCQ